MKPVRWNITLIIALLIVLGGCQFLTISPSPTATPRPTAQPSPAAVAPTSTPTEQLREDSVTPTPSPTRPPDQQAALRPEAQDDLANLTDLTRYDIDLAIDYENRSFDGRQTVDFTNTERTPLDKLNFRLFPNGQRAYGNGSLMVSEVTVNGTPVEPALSLEDTVLEARLPAILEPGASARLTLEFRGIVPEDFGSGDRPGYGIYNFSDGVMALSGWFPILAVFDDEGWNLDPTSGVGDSVYADAAFYTVDITARSDLTVVATGVPVSQVTLNDTTRHQYVSGPVRDFFIALSPDFQQMSDSAGNVTVNSYYLPGHEAGGESALVTAIDALRVFNQRFGPYPYTELDIVDAPMQNAAGVEYPGVILVGDFLYDNYRNTFFETATAHEVAHQWWYNVVGNDVIDEPWLDEALVTYSSAIYFEEIKGTESSQQILDQWEQAYNQAVEEGADNPITNPLGFWEQSGNQRYYGTIVYLKGALFFDAIRQEIGNDAFFEALRSYYQANKYGIGTPEELLNAFEEAAGRQLDELYEEWLYSARS